MNDDRKAKKQPTQELGDLRRRITELEKSDTDRQQAEERHQRLAIKILGILNDSSALTEAINRILSAIRQEMGFDAVGIRLRSGEDFPYFFQEGFSNDFLLAENTLGVRTKDGGLCRDENGHYSLECTCGLVISGRTDPTNPLFTPGGSVWTNNSLTLLDLSPDQDPRLHPRNRCVHEGFLSLALIPIRENQEIIGLLQLNDRKKDRLTLDMIRFFEGISASICVALKRKQAEEALRESEENYRNLFQNANEAIFVAHDGKIEFLNPRLTTMTGYSSEELMSRPFIEFIHPEDRDKVMDRHVRRMKGEEIPQFYDFRIIDKNENVRWVELKVVMVNWKGKTATLNLMSDITERKQAEEALEEMLKENETLLHSLLNYMHDAMVITNWDGSILFANLVAIKMLELERPEDIVGHNIVEYLHPDFFQKAVEDLEAVKADKMGFISDYQLCSVKGRRIWVETIGGKIVFHNVSANLVCIRDVTERKQAKVDLQRLAAIVESSDDAIFSWDLQGIVLTWNKGAERIYGYSAEQILGKYVSVLFPSGYQEELSSFLKRIAQGEHVDHYETLRIRKDGVLIDVSLTLSPVKDASGRIVGASTIARDITERKQAEKALRESEEKYRELVEKSNSIILRFDRDGKITFINEFGQHFFGYTAAEILGRNVVGTIVPEIESTGEDLELLIDRIRANPDDFKQNINENMRRNGDRVWISWANKTILDRQGQVLEILSIGSDITERKRVEDALQESEKRYHSIFDNAREGIFRSTPEGRLIMANQAVANILGYDSPGEVIAEIARHVHPEERTKIIATIEEHGFVENYETQLYRKDGSIFWVSMTMHAVRDTKGQILYYEGISEDITTKKDSVERLRKALGAIIQAMAVTVETRDPYTAGHQRRVADLARAIAMEMNLFTDQIDGIGMAAVIHDLGKISVPGEILSKPTKLKKAEFDLIKDHSQAGYDILKDIDFPWPIAKIVLEHHERMNGSGYPDGLTGDEILLESRILSIADVVEAMASHRPYRPGLGIDAALNEIEKNKGIFYDNAVADACLRLFREKGFKLEGI